MPFVRVRRPILKATMKTKTLSITPTIARRLAIAAQNLAGPLPDDPDAAILDTVRQIRCLQLDPIRVVDRTQYLVLWSRVGNYDRDHFHRLVHEDRHFFEYWAHCASLVLLEDYPIHEYMMRGYGKSGSAWSKRVSAWVKENAAFRQYILDELAARGPLRTQDFEDGAHVPWSSGGWTSGRSVAYMLDHLWLSGQIMVARRNGLERWWDLAERVLPLENLAGGWRDTQVTYDAAQKSLQALGIGRTRDIQRHFIERRYPQLSKIMTRLQKEKKVLPVTVEGWPGAWFVHADMLPLLEEIVAGGWQPRTTLLSPFDNLIRDRDRTELMWDFFYRIEIYVPPAKRQYGYYVLPILHGDQLIGRIDPKMDWKKGVLTINAIYTEATTPLDTATGQAVVQTIEQLALFLDAKQIVYGDNLPSSWRSLTANS
jgi:uncharacterized protein